MSPATSRRVVGWLFAVAVVVGSIMIGTWAQGGGIAASGGSASSGPATGGLSHTSGPSATRPLGSLAVVALAGLPPAAAETVERLRAGGPYPYRQDGAVFENRERRLPAQPSGYYREYTVPTPGAGDRGVRRIVAGSRGELYWSPDHYDSFFEIAR